MILSSGILPSSSHLQLLPSTILSVESSVHRKGSISHFWIEILVLPTLKQPTIVDQAKSHPSLQLE